jgi:hypothetical protein
MCEEVLKRAGLCVSLGNFQKNYCVRVAGLVLAIEPECGSLEIAA